jgi:hypothetical protein
MADNSPAMSYCRIVILRHRSRWMKELHTHIIYFSTLRSFPSLYDVFYVAEIQI